jgi:hypothetical protein
VTGGQSETDLARGPAGLALLAAVALAILAYLSFSPELFNDGDTSWHLGAGRWMLENGAIPDHDPFSFTFAGKPWTAHEWLSEIIMAGLLRIGGWNALGLLTATAVAALLLMVGAEARRHWRPTIALAVMLALFIVLIPFIVARPHVLAWPILAGWTIILIRAREADRAPPLPAALLMLLWANLHGSFLIGLLLIGPFALEAAKEAKWQRTVLLRWAAFGILSLLLSLATPHGVYGLLFPLQVSGMEALPLIKEWLPTPLLELKGFQIVLLGTIVAALAMRVRVPLFRLLLLLGMLYMALEHVRHQAVLAIVAALVLPPAFARDREKPKSAASSRSLALGAGLLLAVAAIWAVRLALPEARQDSASNPLAAITAVPVGLRGVRVFNSYSFGGPLILNRIRPFIDGRADMYGDAFMFEWERIHKGDAAAFERAARRWGIGWTILEPGAQLVALLDKKPGWRRIYSDDWAVIHQGPAPSPNEQVLPSRSSKEV